MNPSRPESRHAHTQPPRVLRVSACRERRCFLVPDLNESEPLLVCSQCLEDSVDAVSRQSENRIHVPVNQPLDEGICNRSFHSFTSAELLQGLGNLRRRARNRCASCCAGPPQHRQPRASRHTAKHLSVVFCRATLLNRRALVIRGFGYPEGITRQNTLANAYTPGRIIPRAARACENDRRGPLEALHGQGKRNFSPALHWFHGCGRGYLFPCRRAHVCLCAERIRRC